MSSDPIAQIDETEPATEPLTEPQLRARLDDVTAQIVAIGVRIEELIAARAAGAEPGGNRAERNVLVEKRFHLYREEGMLRHRIYAARRRELTVRRRAQEDAERAERAGAQAKKEAERAARDSTQKQAEQETGHAAFNRKVALEVERRLATAAATQPAVSAETRALLVRGLHEAMLKGERAMLVAGEDPMRPSHAALFAFFNETNIGVPAVFRAFWNEDQARLGHPPAMTCEAVKARMAIPKEERRGVAVRTYVIDERFDDGPREDRAGGEP